jgi:hypothetical protein
MSLLISANLQLLYLADVRHVTRYGREMINFIFLIMCNLVVLRLSNGSEERFKETHHSYGVLGSLSLSGWKMATRGLGCAHKHAKITSYERF